MSTSNGDIYIPTIDEIIATLEWDVNDPMAGMDVSKTWPENLGYLYPSNKVAR